MPTFQFVGVLLVLMMRKARSASKIVCWNLLIFTGISLVHSLFSGVYKINLEIFILKKITNGLSSFFNGIIIYMNEFFLFCTTMCVLSPSQVANGAFRTGIHLEKPSPPPPGGCAQWFPLRKLNLVSFLLPIWYCFMCQLVNCVAFNPLGLLDIAQHLPVGFL